LPTPFRRRWWRSRWLCLGFGLPNFFIAGVIFFTLQDAEPDWFPEGYEVGAGFGPSNLL
jgi:hypothetical protein